MGHVSLFSDPGIQINEKREFTITKMRLTGDYNFLWSMFIRLWIAGIVLFGLFHLVRYQMQKLRVKFNVSAEEFSFSSIEQGTDFKNLILKFMEENYFNSELKSADLANFLKVPEYKISGILKQTIGISFKSLLNQTRIEAARNSLKTSSLSISEIAYKTGFNSPSSFNRVFKEITSKAPGDFRLDY